MSAKYTVPVREAAERSGFTPQQILNRLNRRKKGIRAKKFGWIWLLAESEVQQLIAEKQKQAR